jgi:hypothetical protein
MEIGKKACFQKSCPIVKYPWKPVRSEIYWINTSSRICGRKIKTEVRSPIIEREFPEAGRDTLIRKW